MAVQAVLTRRQELCTGPEQGSAASERAAGVQEAAWQLAWVAGELRDAQLAAFSGVQPPCRVAAVSGQSPPKGIGRSLPAPSLPCKLGCCSLEACCVLGH